MDRKRIGERVHADIEGTPRGGERLLRLENDGEFRQVVPPYPHERARAPLAGNGAGMGEGVTDLAQRDRVVERRQIERAVGDRWTQGHEFESVGW